MTAYTHEAALPRTRLALVVDSRILGLPWPLAVFCAAQLAVWTAMPALLTRALHPSTAELVMWGRDFYWVNYKHPALTSWVMDLAFGALGVHLWAVYLVGQVFVIATYVFVYLLGRALLDVPRATIAPMLVAGLTYFGPFSIKFNHNLVQLPFWAGFAWFLWQATEKKHMHWWMLAAAMAALGLYGKFSTAMPIALGCAWIVADPEARAQLRSWRPYAGLALFLLLMAPLAYALWRTDFLTLTWISRESDAKGVSWHSYDRHQGVFLLRIVILAALAGAIGLRRAASESRDRRKRRYLLLMGAGPLLLTFVLAPFLELRNAWSVPMYSLMGLVLLEFWPGAVLRRVTLRAALVPLAAMAFMAVSTGRDLIQDARGEVPGQYAYPQAKIAHRLTKVWHTAMHRPLAIVGGDPYTASLVGVDSKDRPSMFSDLDPRESPAITPERIARDGMLIVWQDDLGWSPPASWLQGRHVGLKLIRWSKDPRSKPIAIRYAIVPPRPPAARPLTRAARGD
jgi:4-amino-4-deoxy-L-arabinose transferase-like glycosyltransferase